MEQRKNILVSACLLGEACRYDGKSQPCEKIEALAKVHNLVPVCPEQLGGLPTPRTPSEIQPDGRVVNREGLDCTQAFVKGAEAAVSSARDYGCTCAILKSKSPSCGVNEVYDGTFTCTIVPGRGIAAAALDQAGVVLSDETDFEGRLDIEVPYNV